MDHRKTPAGCHSVRCSIPSQSRVVTHTGRSLGNGWAETGLKVNRNGNFWHQLMQISFRDSRTIKEVSDDDASEATRRQHIPQNLCAEESTLRLLNHLLVHRLRWVVHDHRTLLVVNLGINPGVADQVDDPLLALILAQAETGRQVPNTTVSAQLLFKKTNRKLT